MSAKFQFYRNLHTKTFSLRYRGKVIGHPTSVLCSDCTFIVSDTGRQKVLREKRKNVHAYIASMSHELLSETPTLSEYIEVYYNPYTTDSFVVKGTENKVLKVDKVLLHDNRVYIPSSYLKMS